MASCFERIKCLLGSVTRPSIGERFSASHCFLPNYSLKLQWLFLWIFMYLTKVSTSIQTFGASFLQLVDLSLVNTPKSND